MRLLFRIYVVWYIIVLMLQGGLIGLPKGYGKYIIAFVFLNLLYLCISPSLWSRFHKKAYRYDIVYYDVCLCLIPARFIAIILGVLWQMDSIYVFLGLDLLAMFLYLFAVLYIRNKNNTYDYSKSYGR